MFSMYFWFVVYTFGRLFSDTDNCDKSKKNSRTHFLLDQLNHLLGHLLSQVDASHLEEEGLGGDLDRRDQPGLPVEGQRGRKAEPWFFGSQSH